MNIGYKIHPLAAVFAMTAVSVACSDRWDDHYSAGLSEGGKGTLWEAISERPELTNFSSLVSQCGYETVLGGSQGYTVFAPTNESLTPFMVDSLVEAYNTQNGSGVRVSDNTVVKQFLQNHIALYKRSVSSMTNDTIVMMNGKYQSLTSTEVGGEALLSTNTLCDNGMLYTIGNPIKYFPNVFEYLGQDEELDSVANFLNKYNEYVFQADKSVPGDIIDGQTVYLDSVVTLFNSILSSIGFINSEDSTYWMLAPTNSEWNKYIPEYESYFNYNNTVNRRDSLQYTNARMALISGSVFNRTENPDEAFRDSAVSTVAKNYGFISYDDDGKGLYYVYDKPFDAGGIFSGAKDVACSNGHVLKTSDFRISKYDTFLQTIKTEAESVEYVDTIVNAEDPLTEIVVLESNPFYKQVSGGSYVDVVPKTPDVNPIVTFKIDGVLSNVGYDIYVVFAPPAAGDILTSDVLPNSFRAYIGYCNQDGKQQSNRITTRFYTTPNVVDSVLVASNFKFPTCSQGLSDNEVTLQLQSVVSSKETSTYSRTMHIDCILLVPHDKNVAEVRKRKK